MTRNCFGTFTTTINLVYHFVQAVLGTSEHSCKYVADDYSGVFTPCGKHEIIYSCK